MEQDESFGSYVRAKRQLRKESDPAFSLRQVAGRVELEPSYLSKVERGDESPPSEAKICALAEVLGEDPDLLLAMAGRVSSDLRQAIVKRPRLFGELIRQLKDAPDHAVLRVVREVRDGKW